MSDYFLAGKKGTTEHAAVWVPDSEASTCMHCLKSKFTALNRRVCISVNLNDQCCFIDTLGTLQNYNGDGNGNITKGIGLMSKTTTLHVHHALLRISLPSMHNYDIK